MLKKTLKQLTEQLNHQQVKTCLLAIDELGKIAQDTPSHHWYIMEVLSDFIRKSPPVEHPEIIHIDTQAALHVISQRNIQYDPENKLLDLSFANIHGVNLDHANLQRINFYQSNFKNASFRNANLHQVILAAANLAGTNLAGANLSCANLSAANLQGANLHSANLHRANLYLANLQGAILSQANMWEANLRQANLQGVNMESLLVNGCTLTSGES
jgi:Pentapeptide repeats (9 copies)